MPATTIAAIRATPVTVPLEAPILHSNGAHWGRFVRTIVEVETADGYVGLGEMGGGGEDADARVRGLADYLRGHDVFRLEAMRFAICNPTASLYNNRTQLHAAIEFACLDIMGQKLGVPVHALLGGKLRDEVEFASYLFFRYDDPAPAGRSAHGRAAGRSCRGAQGAARLPRAQAQRRRLSARARACLLSRAGRGPRRAIASATTRTARCRSPTRSISAAAILDLRNDYFEDPVWGMPQLARLKEFVPLPVATNTVIVNFEQLAANERSAPSTSSCSTRRSGAASARASRRPASARRSVSASRSTAPASSASSSRRCCIWAPSCRISVTPPTRIIIISPTTSSPAAGCLIANGAIAVPDGNGLGVTLDRDKLAQYHELYRELGGYPYDRDPGRPGWYPTVPNHDWADPEVSLRPNLK